MVNLIHEKYATYYHANKMSPTFFFCVIIYFLIILVPFLVGFTSNNFWIRAAYYYEQPTIISLDQYILEVKTISKSYFYTNIPEILRERSNSELLPQVQMSSQSDDSLTSEMPKAQNFSIQIQLQQNADQIQYVQLISMYQYQLTGTVKMTMQSFAEIALSAQAGMSYGTVVGQINLQQRHPLMPGDVFRIRYNYPPYYDRDGALLPILTEMKQYPSCRISQSDPLLPTLDVIQIYYYKFQRTKNYITSLLETLKSAWVQYFSFFLIFWFFGTQLLSFLIESGVYTTSKFKDLPSFGRKKYQ